MLSTSNLGKRILSLKAKAETAQAERHELIGRKKKIEEEMESLGVSPSTIKKIIEEEQLKQKLRKQRLQQLICEIEQDFKL